MEPELSKLAPLNDIEFSMYWSALFTFAYSSAGVKPATGAEVMLSNSI